MLKTVMRLFVLLAAIVQIVTPVYVNPFREGGKGLSVKVASQIEPAGYAFSIWGPIYLLALGYAVWQLTARGRADPVTARIAPLAIVLYAGSSIWLSAAQFGPLWATMPILVVMAACAVWSLLIASNTPIGSEGSQKERFFAVELPFGLYAGWTTCAAFVNVAEVAPAFGFDRFGLSVPGYAVSSIAVAAVISSAILWTTRGSLPFAGTVVWALVAILIAALARGHASEVVIAAGVAIASVVAVTTAARMRGDVPPANAAAARSGSTAS